jgi:Amt family ammonium transporter
VFRASLDAQIVLENGVVVECNAAALSIFGVVSAGAVVGRTVVELSPPRQLGGRLTSEASSEMIAAGLTAGTHRCGWLFIREGGEELMVALVLTAFRVGEHFRLHARVRVVEEDEGSAEIAELDARTVALQLTSDAVLSIGVCGRVRDINRAVTRLLGCSREEAVGAPLRELFVIETVDERRRVYPWERAEGRVRAPGRCCGEYVLIPRDGEEMMIELSCAPARAAGLEGHIVVIHDITNARAMAQQLAWQARHDALTGLLNRREFRARLESLARSSA